ncbi:hypothetical protein V5O48_010457 [Marasmius crinis-equi]|uniref:Uncharacterized protein n=1 Tax=Marasmius crinis-equi TaxID=585013 RepID=A0ABR3F8A3_9AGAR
MIQGHIPQRRDVGHMQQREGLKIKYRARLPRFSPTAIFTQYATTTSSRSEEEKTESSTVAPVTYPTTPPIPSSASTTSSPMSSTTSKSTDIVITPLILPTSYPSSAPSTITTGSTTSSPIASDSALASGNSALNNKGGTSIVIAAAAILVSIALLCLLAFFWRKRNMQARAKRHRSTLKFRSMLMVKPSTNTPKPSSTIHPSAYTSEYRQYSPSIPSVMAHQVAANPTMPLTPVRRRPYEQYHDSMAISTTGQLDSFWQSVDVEPVEAESPATFSIASARRSVPPPQHHEKNVRHSIAASHFSEFPQGTPPDSRTLDQFPVPPPLELVPASRYSRRPSVPNSPASFKTFGTLQGARGSGSSQGVGRAF